jgi:hypothetical protein
MNSEFQITHLLSYSSDHKDSLDVASAVESIRNWENALVGSIKDLVSVFRELGWSQDEIATTLEIAFMHSANELNQAKSDLRSL